MLACLLGVERRMAIRRDIQDREGGLAVAHKAWSFGGGSCMMGIEALIPAI